MEWTWVETFSLISLGGALLVLVTLPLLSVLLAKYQATRGSTILILLSLPSFAVLIYVFFGIRKIAALDDAFGMVAGFFLGLFSLAVLLPRSENSFFTRTLESIESIDAKKWFAYVIIGTAILLIIGVFSTFILPFFRSLDADVSTANAAQGVIIGLSLSLVAYIFTAYITFEEREETSKET